MDKNGIFRYFTKATTSTTSKTTKTSTMSTSSTTSKSITVTEQNSESSDTNSTSGNQIPSNANFINTESTIPTEVDEATQNQEKQSLAQITQTPNDLGDITEGPRQPKIESFPFSLFGNANRAFKSQYYNEFPFIEYSISTDSIFCFCCRQFSSGKGNSELSFSKTGFRNWKHIGDKLTKHLSSNEHTKCMDRWNNYKQSLTSGSVSCLISTAHSNEVNENKLYIEKLFSILLYITTQFLAIRGYDESDNSSNTGHFLELCKLFANFDLNFANKFANNISLTSHQLQDEMIETISFVYEKNMLIEIQNAGFYCILADEARSHTNEFISICVRYFNDLKICE